MSAIKKATKDNVNRVAALVYGYQVPRGYDFSAAHHPQETRAWNLSCAIFKFITGESPEPIDEDEALAKKFREAFSVKEDKE